MSTATVLSEHREPPLILTLDIGTSSVRAMLFDRWGRALEKMTARRSLELETTKRGRAVAAPDAVLDRVWSCIDELLHRARRSSGEIRGVAVCTFVSNVLGVDDQGRMVSPLMTYADTRSVDEVEELCREFDEEAVHQRTGCPFHTSYLPAQLLWFAHNRPEIFDRVVRWMSIGEYMESLLFLQSCSGQCGETTVSYSVASWTGLLDRRELVWDAPLLAALPLGVDQLSSLVDTGTLRRGLREPFASRWPVLQGIPWFVTLSDGATANVGSGCLTANRVSLTMGTTSAVRLMTDEEVERVPEGLWCYRADRQRSLPGGASSEGGSVFAWMRELLSLPPRPNMDASLERMEPDAHGLTVLPFLAGERSPGWAGEARATIHGLTLATTPLDVLRAGMEAVAYRIALIIARLGRLLPADFQVVASGGALLSSSLWVQIVADVLGRPVALSEVAEASARGAALLALEALGALDTAAAAPSFIGRVVMPDDARHARYQEAMERQQALYERLITFQEPDSGGRC